MVRNMEKQQLSINDLRPFVRFVQRFETAYKTSAPGPWLDAYDNRIFYIRYGSGNIRFKDKMLDLRRGDIIMWNSATPYQMTYTSDEPMVTLGCNFDFTHEHSRYSYPIPPDNPDEFNADMIFENYKIVECPFSENPILVHNMQVLEIEFEEMLREYQNQLNFTSNKLSGMMLKILSTAYRQVIADSRLTAISSSKIDQIIEYIHIHYSEDLSNEMLGDVFELHPNYINKLMLQTTGKSTHQYIISCRINRAINLISTTDIPIHSIAENVGYHDIPHFTRIFKQRTGKSPNEYRVGSKKIRQ